MTDYLFPLQEPASVTIAEMSQRIAVRRIFCVGRNYAAHAREMGQNPERDPPFFFTKPADAVVAGGSTIPYPPMTGNFHYEGELVVVIGRRGFDIGVEAARDYIYGYAAGIDLTRRDLQLQAREKGRPWDWGKAFDRSAVCGPVHPCSEVGHPESGAMRLSVNGEVKQDADIRDLIWSVPEVVSILSRSMVIEPGDLIYTGTPAGVGPLLPGDHCRVSIEGIGEITLDIEADA